MIKVIFMGTPAFAVPSLEAVVGLEGFEVITVISQPDRPAGRGQTLQPSAVKAQALELGLPVWTPENLKGAETQEQLRALGADLFVVAAYGEILRRAVLEMPRYGAINVHASLLPRHRGASPIAAAIAAGDTETGVTIMLMDVGMDTGDMLAMQSIPIRPDHTTGTLTPELAHLGANLLAQTLPRWVAGELTPQPQDHAAATATRLGRKEDGQVDWTRPAEELARLVRAYDPWPGTYSYWKGQLIKILAADAIELDLSTLPPGTVVAEGDTVAVATGAGWLRLHRVQLAGKKAMEIVPFVNGYQDFVGSVLGE